MKKIKIILLLMFAPLLVSCTKIISNPDVQTLNQKAVELMNSGDIKGAIARLESINDLNPNFPQNHYNLGVAYYKNEEYAKSIDSLKKAISLDKSLADAYYTIGLAYQEIAGKEIEKIDKKDGNEKPVANINSDPTSNSEEKQLSKPEILALIVENLKNSKDYFVQYAQISANSGEKDKITQEIENIDLDIKKYEEQLSSPDKKE